MTYEQALDYIHATPNFARKAGLTRIRALTRALGEPERQFPCVHIGGTNGKGSTAAMTAAILQAAGYRVGLFTSPYLERFNERIRVNGQDIPDERLAEVTERVKQGVETIQSAGVETPNEFELVTAMGLTYFAQEGVDIAVLEVGLGGRYDATNVIPPPLCAAVTSISLDHTAVLGDTLAAIAWEKGGILKAGSAAVLSPDQAEESRRVLCQAAEEAGCPLTESRRDQITVLGRGARGLRFRWAGEEILLPLLGAYQADNVCTVLSIAACLNQRGFSVSAPAVKEGLSRVTWAGRLELLDGGAVLLDAGHNPGGIAALRRELDTTFAGRGVVTVMGMLRDKDYAPCLHQVAARSRAFFAVSPPSPRALAAEEIAAQAASACAHVTPCKSISQALEQALVEKRPDELLLVCGSIPLVGEARIYLRARRETAKNA